MHKRLPIYHRINGMVLAVLLVLFTLSALVANMVNQNNIRTLYEKSYTERVLLTNALMASGIDSAYVSYYVNLLKSQGEDFAERQVQYYHDRLNYWDLLEGSAPQAEYEALEAGMRAFHEEAAQLKNANYWKVISIMRDLKAVSHSSYLYIMADTGLVNEDGETLYSFIFDADEEPFAYLDAPDMDGLGTSDVSQDTITTVYETKTQMDYVAYYNDIYGELYYAYAPIFDSKGEVIAVFGTDLDLTDMNAAIQASVRLFNLVFTAILIIISLVLFLYLHYQVIKPIESLTDTAHELAEGNIYAPTSGSALVRKSEIGTLARAVYGMSRVYQEMIQNAGSLFAAASIGKLGARSDTSRYKGDVAGFIGQINKTLDATTLYLNGIPESLFIMGRDYEMHFCNRTYVERFGEISPRALMEKVFPDDGEGGDRELSLRFHLEVALRQEDSIIQWLGQKCYAWILREISLEGAERNSILVIAIDITDLMQEKERAQAAAEAKTNFLSRMSHEMRTPMNAIIGMAKIAETTEDTGKLKYCLETIDTSSRHLLGIINDVLDMSKIEAGKFELETAPMNIEKILMKVCSIMVDNMEKKGQTFSVILEKDLELSYLGDALRLSQVITNLLSNAMKFTPEGGKITLSVTKAAKGAMQNTLRFAISDTGIGMTEEQKSRLFAAFEQADGSVSRKYGGTGLGLAISKNIVEKMGGRIWVDSAPGAGSTFSFETPLTRAQRQDRIVFDGINPEDIRLLIIEGDEEMRARFLDIVESFGMKADVAGDGEEALSLVSAAANTAKAYDIIFLDYAMPGGNGLDIAAQLRSRIDGNTVIIITTFTQWHDIEGEAAQMQIGRYITKPLFPSSILDAINDVIGSRLNALKIKAVKEPKVPNFAGVRIILAEDVAINREITLALLEPTQIAIDCAENGMEAVALFEKDPERYAMILMDIQMPEMDGYTATRAIRALDRAKAKDIPIVAMTANVFKEDIERCMAAGMNDHIGKPIDSAELLAKLERYTR